MCHIDSIRVSSFQELTMREYARVSPKFWINLQGREIKKMGVEAQLIALYLITNPHANMIGVYYLPITTMAHETGISYEDTLKAIEQLIECDYCSYDETFEYVWVHEMAIDQVGIQLKINDNRVKAINDLVEGLPELNFVSHFISKYSIKFYIHSTNAIHLSDQGALKSLPSQEKEEDQEKNQEQEDMSGKPDVYPLNNFLFEQPSSHLPSLNSQALEVLNFLNEKTGRAYRPVDSNLKLITARLKTGATVMDCRQVIAKKTREWKANIKMAEYLRPETLFNAVKFEQYIGECVEPDEEENNELSQ